MIFPSKHITLAQSIFGLAGILLKFLDKPKDVDDLWLQYQYINNTKSFPAQHDYGNFILAVYFLFTVGLINLDERGNIFVCN